MKPVAYRIGVAGDFVHAHCWKVYENAERTKRGVAPHMGDLFGAGAPEIAGKCCLSCGGDLNTPMLVVRMDTGEKFQHYFSKFAPGNGDLQAFTLFCSSLRGATIFHSPVDAAETMRVMADHIRRSNPSGKACHLDIVSILSIPACEGFDEAFPIDPAHAPLPGKTVELLERDGAARQISSDQLSADMLSGVWNEANPLRDRWRYVAPLPAKDTRTKLMDRFIDLQAECYSITDESGQPYPALRTRAASCGCCVNHVRVTREHLDLAIAQAKEWLHQLENTEPVDYPPDATGGDAVQ